ncbi:hypothetical protein BUALT_Bualt12G0022300 [Buddleja alternifolia]|uniref:Carbonic anhydrase n=1 Tax=Buddleja alternifolia TaxID=168488 RepID=A0AAV6WLU4_9LAMI|nr:hypothetical protein BUALT_Bualt12G0022300 [Buddleja alternifolia]
MRTCNLFVTFLLLNFLLIAVIADDSEVEDESPFTYDDHTNKGPKNWVNLNPKWKACGNGKLQSPIDLTDDRVVLLPTLGHLRRTYKPAPAVIRNRGHDISVGWTGDAGGVVINGTEYRLRQCHWHTPSEHTVNGKSFKMEIHLVHNDSREHIAVVGIMYKLGRPDPFLAKASLSTLYFLQKIRSLDHEEIDVGYFLQKIRSLDHEEIDVGYVDPWDIKFGSRKYLRYMGSLTIPPCTEGVLWTILKKVRTVSREQIRALRNAVHDGFEDNARPTQASDERDVYMYRPGVGKTSTTQ